MRATLPHGLKAWPVLWEGAHTAPQDGAEMSKDVSIKNTAERISTKSGYEILYTTRVQHGCCRRFDPGLRLYDANKHRKQSESPAALGPRGPAWQWEHSVLLPADGSVSVRQLTWLEQYSPAQPVV